MSLPRDSWEKWFPRFTALTLFAVGVVILLYELFLPTPNVVMVATSLALLNVPVPFVYDAIQKRNKDQQ